MKHLALILCLLSLNAFSQKVDWVNAPLNPIAVAYKLEHFQLKGDVYYRNGHYFDTNGSLISKSDRSGDVNYFYENGQLINDSANSKYAYDANGYIISKGDFEYQYNSKGLLTLEIQNKRVSGVTTVYKTSYTYDSSNRLIKKEHTSDNANFYYTYTYKKISDILQVHEERFEKGISKFKQYNEFKNGRKIFAKEDDSDIHTKIEYKLDAKGNVTQEDYVQTNGVRDEFPSTVVYHSQATPSTITIDNGGYAPKVLRNGKSAPDVVRYSLRNKTDALLYDGLTKTYYKVVNLYGSSANKQNNITPQKLTQGFEAIANTFKEHVDIYYRGLNIFYQNDIQKSIMVYKTLLVYHLPRRVFKSYNYQFDKCDLAENGFYGGNLLPSNTTSVFYAKQTDGLVATYRMVVAGVSIADKMMSIGYLSNNVDLVVEHKEDKQRYVLIGFANAKNQIVYQGKYYSKNEDGEINELSSKNDTNNQDSKQQQNTSVSNPTKPASTATCTFGNCQNGFGVQEKDDFIIESFFTNGQANGYGYLRYKTAGDYYYGTFKDGLRDGFGMYTWKSTGVYYIGQWKSGNMHGYGYLKKDKDITQAGYYENGKQVRNMLTQAYINKQWNGNCVGDCNNGFGYYKYTDGSYYVGFYTNKKPNYIGSYVFTNGTAYIGEWLNGNRTGQGTETYTNNNNYRGGFVNSKRQGLGVYADKDEKIISKGLWDSGELKTSY